MKYVAIAFFLVLFTVNSAFAQNKIKIRKATGCFEFIDLYAKVIEGTEDPTIDDQHRFDLAYERMLGYIAGVEMGTRTKIIIRDRGITEISLLGDVNRACLVAPNITLDEAILTLPVVNAAILSAGKSGNTENSCDEYCRENYGE